jgi:transposase
MAIKGDSQSKSVCRSCGYIAVSGSDNWNRISAPPFRRITQCPECGSTDVISGR